MWTKELKDIKQLLFKKNITRKQHSLHPCFTIGSAHSHTEFRMTFSESVAVLWTWCLMPSHQYGCFCFQTRSFLASSGGFAGSHRLFLGSKNAIWPSEKSFFTQSLPTTKNFFRFCWSVCQNTTNFKNLHQSAFADPFKNNLVLTKCWIFVDLVLNTTNLDHHTEIRHRT